MSFNSCRKLIKLTSTILFILSVFSFIFAQGIENLSDLQKQARIYRAQGLEFQALGNLEEAKVFYQKAIEVDPTYAAAYNDLGIISEADGLIDLAEESYLKAIEVEPNFLSAYSNLGLLYEKKGELEKAIPYWTKRAELGSNTDPWTEKARQHSQALSQILEKPGKNARVARLIKDVRRQKYVESKDNKELAKTLLKKAKLSYEKQDLVVALKQAVDASLLDPSNKEIEEFIAKVLDKLLSR